MKRATDVQKKLGITVDISIHALVKRATFAKALSDKGINISIHALVKRATDGRRECIDCYTFQSTPS